MVADDYGDTLLKIHKRIFLCVSLTAIWPLLVSKGATTSRRVGWGLGSLDARIISNSATATSIRRNSGRLVAGEVLTLLLFLNMKDEVVMQNQKNLGFNILPWNLFNVSEVTYLDKLQSLGLGCTFKISAVCCPCGIIVKSDRRPPLWKLTVTILELRCGWGFAAAFLMIEHLIDLENNEKLTSSQPEILWSFWGEATPI